MSEIPADPFTAPLDGVIAQTADYVARVLQTEEYITRAHEFSHYPNGLPDPSHAVVVIVEEKATRRIVFSHQLLQTAFLEGLYVAPDARGNPNEIHALGWGSMLALMAEMGIAHPLTIVQSPAMLALARKAGFTEVAGTLLKLE